MIAAGGPASQRPAIAAGDPASQRAGGETRRAGAGRTLETRTGRSG
jgi:hypothetical protein